MSPSTSKIRPGFRLPQEMPRRLHRRLIPPEVTSTRKRFPRPRSVFLNRSRSALLNKPYGAFHRDRVEETGPDVPSIRGISPPVARSSWLAKELLLQVEHLNDEAYIQLDDNTKFRALIACHSRHIGHYFWIVQYDNDVGVSRKFYETLDRLFATICFAVRIFLIP